MPTPVPTVTVNPKGAQRLRKGQVWVYRQDVTDVTPGIEGGAVVHVVDSQKNPIGQAFYSQKSPLALRFLARANSGEGAADLSFFHQRLNACLERRKPWAHRNAYRLVHGEADGLPGYFVDQYVDALVVQTISEGAYKRRSEWSEYLKDMVNARIVIYRDDASGRDFEGLPREKGVLFGSGPTRVIYLEGKLKFGIDLIEDMKTGGFLDQVDNHLRLGEWARGEVLDLFSYHGGFALAAAPVADRVLAVEQDSQAVLRIQQNIARNGLSNVTTQEGNSFDVLHEFDKSGRKFDTIVLDPPGLAKRKEGVDTALRAYHELNLRALKCLRPNGLFVTCSCSGKVSREDFENVLVNAARDAKRTIQILERRGAGMDHPVLPTLPETEYLKAFFVRAL
jgi:23S rRNA (cytosine1962-C5)-methyltransferase